MHGVKLVQATAPYVSSTCMSDAKSSGRTKFIVSKKINNTNQIRKLEVTETRLKNIAGNYFIKINNCSTEQCR